MNLTDKMTIAIIAVLWIGIMALLLFGCTTFKPARRVFLGYGQTIRIETPHNDYEISYPTWESGETYIHFQEVR